MFSPKKFSYTWEADTKGNPKGEATSILLLTHTCTPPLCPQHTLGRNSLLQCFGMIYSPARYTALCTLLIWFSSSGHLLPPHSSCGHLTFLLSSNSNYSTRLSQSSPASSLPLHCHPVHLGSLHTYHKILLLI